MEKKSPWIIQSSTFRISSENFARLRENFREINNSCSENIDRVYLPLALVAVDSPCVKDVCLRGKNLRKVRIFFFLFKDVEKKVRLKGPKLHTPGRVGTCPPPSKNAGISMLQTPTSPSHVAEAGARVSSP